MPSSPGVNMLGLEITRTGYRKHVKQLEIKTKKELAKMWRIREMSETNKRKIYQALIHSRLTYPPVPLHCTSDTAMKTLQRVQNRGARFITSIRRSDRKTNKYINDKAGLRPLNDVLYERALKTWEKIRTKQRYEWNGVLTYQAPPKKYWPLSIPVVMEGLHPPIYG